MNAHQKVGWIVADVYLMLNKVYITSVSPVTLLTLQQLLQVVPSQVCQ